MRFPAHGMWLIFVGLGVVILFGASDGGISSGRRIGYRTVEPFKSNLVVIQGGLLAVLSLLLGFTLSMAVNRFEARKQLVLGKPMPSKLITCELASFLCRRVRRLQSFSANTST